MFYNNEARMNKNLLLTGLPGSGKTTVIKNVIDMLEARGDAPALSGFYTQEVRKDGERVGFLIKTLKGREGFLAHRDFPSPYRVGNYGVSLENLENMVIPVIETAHSGILIIDEIGKMECFSQHFVRAVLNALDSPIPVLATISRKYDKLNSMVKHRSDVTLLELNLKNRDQMPIMIVQSLLLREGY